MMDRYDERLWDSGGFGTCDRRVTLRAGVQNEFKGEEIAIVIVCR